MSATKVRRVALYARVSSDEQARPEATSIEKQITASRLEVERMILRGEVAEVVAEYRDDISAKKTRFDERPAGRVLLEAARRNEFDTVVFYSIDRFTRNATKGLADFEMMEDDLGLTLVFARENIDTSQPSGKLFRTILAGFAEFETDQIRDRTVHGRRGATRRNTDPETGRVTRWTTGGQPPFGYRINEDHGRVEVDPEAAKAIHRVFELRAQGMSQNQIAERLRLEGFKNRPRRPDGSSPDAPKVAGSISRKLVGAILDNRALLGEGIQFSGTRGQGMVIGPGETVIYDAPAIVTPDRWNAAHAAKPIPTTKPGKKPRVRHNYALGDRIVHEHGDGSTATMFGTAKGLKSVNGWTRYYRCAASRRNEHREAYCDGLGHRGGNQPATSIQADIVEAKVLHAILSRDPDSFLAEWDAQHQSYMTGDGDESLRADQTRLAQARATLDALVVNEATAEGERLAAIRRSIADTEAMIAALAERVDQAQTALNQRDAIRLTLEELMTMEVADKGDSSGGEGDRTATAEETLPVLVKLCEQIIEAVDRGEPRIRRLPDWAVELGRETLVRWGVQATVRSTENPRNPKIEVIVGGYEGRAKRSNEGRVSLWRDPPFG